jgi:carboxylesterase type B
LLQDLAQTNDTLGEDCLFVNVWTKPQTGSKKKPVLVWVFGGGFNFGGTNVRAYNGKYFADQEDVVLVSFNYRTNILGFPGAPGITQNVGLLDQRLAIEWIRDNIAAFGGDPSRITLFGQSAGGMSIDLYNYAYVNDPIIKGTILQSGNVNSYVIRQPADAANAWYTATTQLGCGNETTSTAAAVLACMRSSSTSWQDIERVANPKKGLASLLGVYGPTIDDKTVFSNYRALSTAGNFTNVPALIGNTNYEAGLLILISAGAGEVYPLNVWDSIDQTVFTCPASYASRDRATLGRPVWRYFYGGMYPNLLIPTANISQAWHTSDIPTLFGTSEDSSLEAASPPQVGLGNYIRKAWATFAANPTTGLSSAPFNWPQYNPSANTLVLLGQNNATTAAYGLAADVDQGC